MTKRIISLLEHGGSDSPLDREAEEESLLNGSSQEGEKASARRRLAAQAAALVIGVGAIFLLAHPGLIGTPSFRARTGNLEVVQQRWSLNEFKVSAADTLSTTMSSTKDKAQSSKEAMLAAYKKLRSTHDEAVSSMVETLQEGAELCLQTAEELDTVLSAAEFFASFVPGGQLLGVARESAENACGAMLAVTTAAVGEGEEDEEAIKEIRALRDHIDQRFDALSDQLTGFEQKFTQELFRKWERKMNEIQYKYKSFVQSAAAHYEDWSKLIEYKAQFDHYQFTSFFDLVYDSAAKDPKNLNKWTLYLSRFLATRTKVFALLSDNPMFKSIGETESADYKKDMKLMKAYIRDKTELDATTTYKTLKDLPVLATDLDLSGVAGITGDIKDLPKFLVRLILPDGAGVKGDLKDLPLPLVVLELGKSTALKGDFKDFSPEMLHIGVGSATKVTGEIKDLPKGLLYIDAAAASDIQGDLQDLPPKVAYANFRSAKDLTGNLKDAPKGITALDLASASSVSGEFKALPNSLEYLDCSACQMTGEIKDLPRGLTYLAENGKSTSGFLRDLPSELMYIDLKGYNSVSGSFKDLPKGTTHFGLDSHFGSLPVEGNFTDLPPNLETLDVETQKLCGDWKDAPKTFDANGVARLPQCQKNLPDQKVTVVQMVILAAFALLFCGCIGFCLCSS